MNQTAVAAPVGFFERNRDAAVLNLRDRAFVQMAVLRRCHVAPAHAAAQQVFALVTDHFQKGVVGLDQLAVPCSDDDTQHAHVGQPSQLQLVLLGGASQTLFARQRLLEAPLACPKIGLRGVVQAYGCKQHDLIEVRVEEQPLLAGDRRVFAHAELQDGSAQMRELPER